MKLQDQVISLEISKRLKELGVKQESLFSWTHAKSMANGTKATEEEYNDGTWQIDMSYYCYESIKTKQGGRGGGYVVGCISAFTVAELGEMLPEKILNNSDEEIYWLTSDGKWSISYTRQEMGGSILMLNDKVFTLSTEADARGKILIYLLENNLIPNPKK